MTDVSLSSGELASLTPPRGLAVVTRGTIWPRRQWQFVGAQFTHTISLDCGRLGRGPMHATVDGVLSLTFAIPSRSNPCVLAPAIWVDGREVLIYADTVTRGDVVGVDVFVDRWSLQNGAPIAALDARRAATLAAAGTYRSPLGASWEARKLTGELLTASLVEIALGLRQFLDRMPEHSATSVWSWFVVYAAFGVGLNFVLRRLLRRIPAAGWPKRLAAISILLCMFFGVLGALVVILRGPLG
jgi:hypothetical protein